MAYNASAVKTPVKPRLTKYLAKQKIASKNPAAAIWIVTANATRTAVSASVTIINQPNALANKS